eukprot:8299807-Lingulodinium_polyedra.AAC.1
MRSGASRLKPANAFFAKGSVVAARGGQLQGVCAPVDRQPRGVGIVALEEDVLYVPVQRLVQL